MQKVVGSSPIIRFNLRAPVGVGPPKVTRSVPDSLSHTEGTADA